jgi:hypothetical protein
MFVKSPLAIEYCRLFVIPDRHCAVEPVWIYFKSANAVCTCLSATVTVAVEGIVVSGPMCGMCSCQSFPLAVMSINLTKLVLTSLRENRLNRFDMSFFCAPYIDMLNYGPFANSNWHYDSTLFISGL